MAQQITLTRQVGVEELKNPSVDTVMPKLCSHLYLHYYTDDGTVQQEAIVETTECLSFIPSMKKTRSKASELLVAHDSTINNRANSR